MRVVLFAPFYGESHRQWADGLCEHSSHEVTLVTLPGRHWKWRMHGAAVHFAAKVTTWPAPDRIIVTDMMDVAAFRGLLPQSWRQVPILLYMHENQLTYPWSATDQDTMLKRDRHYGWINYTSMLAADAIAFNSTYHLSSVLEALPGFLRAFPDHQTLDQCSQIADKVSVIHLGVNFASRTNRQTRAIPTLLWNHRWEYDKNPKGWLSMLQSIKDEYDFNLIVCGPSYRTYPPAFDGIKVNFGDRLQHWGYARDRSTYIDLLHRSDIALVTSQQDFFGISVVEAIYYGVTPLLPKRLAYPDYVPPTDYPSLYYQEEQEAIDKVKQLMVSWPAGYRDLSGLVADFAWSQMIQRYDEWITKLA